MLAGFGPKGHSSQTSGSCCWALIYFEEWRKTGLCQQWVFYSVASSQNKCGAWMQPVDVGWCHYSSMLLSIHQTRALCSLHISHSLKQKRIGNAPHPSSEAQYLVESRLTNRQLQYNNNDCIVPWISDPVWYPAQYVFYFVASTLYSMCL